MSDTTGRTVPLSLGRRVVGDFVFAAMKLPLVTFQKDMNVSALVAAREYAQPRPSWCAIFTKAYAKVVAATPALRRVALTFPWERMFEYDETTADVVAEVPAADEKQVVNIPLRQPENCPLPAIDDIVASYRKEPMLLRRVRRAMNVARLPRVLRRWVWWYVLNVSGRKRARYFSTFGVTSAAKWAVESVRPIAPWTTMLHYGTVDAGGKVSMRLTFDHRVLDGSGPAQALVDMETILHTELADELESLCQRWPAQPMLAKVA